MRFIRLLGFTLFVTKIRLAFNSANLVAVEGTQLVELLTNDPKIWGSYPAAPGIGRK
jgi:hypothetical protein